MIYRTNLAALEPIPFYTLRKMRFVAVINFPWFCIFGFVLIYQIDLFVRLKVYLYNAVLANLDSCDLTNSA